jgi:hypothetical protein
MKARGFWLTSADKYLVETAATLMAAHREGRLKSAGAATLIGLLGKIGFSPNDRVKLNLPQVKTQPV